MTTATDLSQKTTHDLWVEGRQFTIAIARPTPTSVLLTVTRPTDLEVVDGAVVLLSTSPINATNFPVDGTPYNADTPADWANPIARIGTAEVVGAYYGILERPFPAATSTQTGVDAAGANVSTTSFTITVNNTDPNAIYYASVHAVSNVIQYFPLGVSSYPLEGADTQVGAGAYTGNIPSYPSAPTSPTPGMVYYDLQLNVVQYYDGVSGSWIPTRADSIVSNSYNPGILGQVYLLAGNRLKVFNGKVWVDVSATNFQVRVGASWVPYRSFTGQIMAPTLPQPGDFYYDFTIQRIHYYDGASWVYPNATNTLYNDGTTLSPAFVVPMALEPEELRPPYLGQLVYNTTVKQLNAWNGTSWNQVNTDQEGVPSYEKVAIGNDGSYDARMALMKINQNQLGWPQLCVELNEEQFNIAIDNALQNYRQLSSGAYTREFILFKLIPGQQKYYLNSAIDHTDHIVDIHKIYRCGPLGIYGGGPTDVWAQAFAQQYYDLAAGGGDLLSTHLVAAYGEELQRLFAGELMFQWIEGRRELTITKAIRGYETIVIEAMMERTDQDLIQDRWANQYIQNWALAELKMMLGLIRSKFTSGTPGAAGTINLNGELLISEARQDMTELSESLLNYEYGGQVGLGNTAFLIG